MDAKIRNLERWRKIEEKKRRRRSMVMKGVEIKVWEINETVRKIWEDMEVSAKIEEVKEIGKENGKNRKMEIVRMENRRGKMEIMKKKIALKQNNEDKR